MNRHLDALTTPFSLSVLTATKGNPSKRLVPDANGKPIRDLAYALGIAAGRVEHVRVAGLDGLRGLLTRIQPNQALVHGIPKGSHPGDVLRLVLAEQYIGTSGTVARTLDCFDYPPGVRLLMFDYDPDPAAPEGIASAGALLTRLTGLWPALANVGWLATTSTSSAIRDKQTGAWLRPPEGMHVYVLTTGNVARLREWLTVKLWVAGYGFCKLATPNAQTGVAAVLERAMVDLMVFSPERLDFVAGACIAKRAPFYQDRPAPELHPGIVCDLDTLPDVAPEERMAYAWLVAEAHNRLVPERRAKIHRHITTATPSLPAPEVEREITTRLARAARGELEPGHLLYFDNGTTLRAGELAHATVLDGKRLADPCEPSYGRGHAVFHWCGGDWRIVSWAHGLRKIYRSVRAAPALPTYHRRRASRITHFKRRLYADPYFGAPEHRAKGIPVAVLTYQETSHV
jgi:hypothetical protein